MRPHAYDSDHAASALPAKRLFDVPAGYLNSASRHPLPRASAAAIAAYARGLGGMSASELAIGERRLGVRKAFARLINAKPSEIAFVPSTVFAENLVVTALDLPRAGNPIVTDRLHFFGSLVLYRELHRLGSPVTVVDPVDGRIDLDMIDDVIGPDTRLVACSLTSAANGFQHDLKALCERAHAKGALVYADIIQAAGATPIDVRAIGVDFCACATYKWLMGDMGLAFLYVREDRLEQLRRPVFGQDQLEMESFLLFDQPIDAGGYTRRSGAPGFFEVGTLGHSAIAALDLSLPLLLELGVEDIEAYRQPFLTRIRSAMLARGFDMLTPAGCRSPILAGRLKEGAPELRRKIAAGDISVTWRDDIMRVSPSFFNVDDDISALEAVLR